MYEKQNKFSGALDLTVTPIVVLILLLIPGVMVYHIDVLYDFDLLILFFLYFSIMIIFSLLALKLIRTFFPFRSGVYSYDEDKKKCYIFNLYSFILILPLYIFLNAIVIVPPPFRKFIYQLMGCKIGKGIIPIGGVLTDPHLTTIGRDAMIGAESMILAHSILSTRHLVLGKVKIGNSVTIGARAIVLPGVTIGDYSMVNAGSLVAMNTKIPEGEIWGGVPAKKIGEVGFDV